MNPSTYYSWYDASTVGEVKTEEAKDKKDYRLQPNTPSGDRLCTLCGAIVNKVPQSQCSLAERGKYTDHCRYLRFDFMCDKTDINEK